MSFPPGSVIYQPTIWIGPDGSQSTINYPLSSCRGRRKALLIGINYTNSNCALRGCHNDVHNVRNFLIQRFGFRDTPEEMVVLLDDPAHVQQRGQAFWPNRANMINAMRWLVQGNAPGDSLFFHYSGHGGQVEDRDGDELDGFDETICPVDFQTAGQIVDDEMHAIMVRGLGPGVRLTALFDSCHSGTALDLPYVYDPYGKLILSSGMDEGSGGGAGGKLTGLAEGILGLGLSLATGRPNAMAANGLKKFRSNQHQNPQGNNTAPWQQSSRQTWSDVIMFSSCKDSQTAADANINGVGATGAMSYAFLTALANGGGNNAAASGMIQMPSFAQLLGMMRGILEQKYFGQVPQLSSGHPMDMQMPFLM